MGSSPVWATPPVTASETVGSICSSLSCFMCNASCQLAAFCFHSQVSDLLYIPLRDADLPRLIASCGHPRLHRIPPTYAIQAGLGPRLERILFHQQFRSHQL